MSGTRGFVAGIVLTLGVLAPAHAQVQAPAPSGPATSSASTPSLTTTSSITTTPRTGITTTMTLTNPQGTTTFTSTPTANSVTTAPVNGGIITTTTFSNTLPPLFPPLGPAPNPLVRFTPGFLNPNALSPFCAFEESFGTCAVEW